MIAVIVIFTLFFLSLGLSPIIGRGDEAASSGLIGATPTDDYITLNLGGGCSDGGFGSQFRTKCQPHGTSSVCSKDHDYTKGDLVCDSYKSCSSGFGHQSVCQRKLAGLCSSDQNGKPALAPQFADHLVSESTTRNTKSCKYSTYDVCETIADYEFIKNLSATRPGATVGADDFNKCTAHFCAQPVEKGPCTNDPETGKPFEKCSRFRAAGNEGSYCRLWLNSQDETTQRSAIQDYCLNNADSGDCKCISRTGDDIYQDVVDSLAANPINDGCWWKPCKNQDSYLVTPDLANPICPENICQSIINVVDVENDVDISNIEQNIQCNFEVKCTADQYKDETGACQPCTKCDETYQQEVLACTINQNRTCEDSPDSCGQGKWSDSGTFFEDDCKDCTICPEGSRVKTSCTNTTDTVCEVIPTSCPEGKYAPKGEDGNFDVCVDCSKCPEGQLVKTPCTQISDVECREREDQPTSDTDFERDLVIGVSVISGLFVLGIGTYEIIKYK